MKKPVLMAVLSAVLASALLVNVGLAASPGTSGDPLVSKSYVDDKINQVLSIISGNPPTDQVTMPSSGEAAAFVPLSLSAGEVLLGGEGTEIILRSGKGIGYCIGENGMVDITTGEEIFNGMQIERNHLLIVPREDGRGVVVQEDAWFIVKGSYTVR